MLKFIWMFSSIFSSHKHQVFKFIFANFLYWRTEILMWCLTSKSPHVFKHSAILYAIGSNVLQCPGALSLWNYSLIGNIGSLTALAPRYSHIPNERGRLTAGVGAIHPMTPRFCNQPTYIPVSTWWKDPVIVGARWRHLPVSRVQFSHVKLNVVDLCVRWCKWFPT